MVVNFIKNGMFEQQVVNRFYGVGMMVMMVEKGYGLMYLGQVVLLEREIVYDFVVMVYYFGVDYFVDMVMSENFQSIIGDK